VADSTYTLGTGRRKTAVARVRLRPGSGTVLINDRPLAEYFPNEEWARAALAPLHALGKAEAFDVLAKVHGGGPTGQSGAVCMGIARALVRLDREAHHAPLREGGHLTRDSRMKERKKYGRAGARRSFQFSKR
jgi:small subunit ribosomal protein S9